MLDRLALPHEFCTRLQVAKQIPITRNIGMTLFHDQVLCAHTLQLERVLRHFKEVNLLHSTEFNCHY